MNTHDLLSARVSAIKPSPTLAIDAKAKKMQTAGGDIINLGVGEPDFDTPEHIKEAAIKAIMDGKTKYTAVSGIPALKEAVCSKFLRDNRLNYHPDQILVSAGAKQSIYNLIQAVINPFDEVIIPCPYWVSYPDMVILGGGIPVYIPTTREQSFKMTATQLRAHITPKTKLLILNSPSNPSGMVYTADELKDFAAVLLDFPQVLIISDDIYEPIMWTHEPFHNIVNVCPELAERTIVVNGVSKAYAMTGWRIGYAAGSLEIISAMTKIQSQSTSNPNSIAQYATVAALNGDQQCVKDMSAVFKKRHDLIYEGLNRIQYIHCLPGQGAFYAFPDISESLPHIDGGLIDDVALADYLLSHTGIAVVPGTAFGTQGCIRLSFATSEAQLTEALERLETVFNH